MLYSVIVPVYNRPEEIRELLQSLTLQTCTNFEVLIIEDGSETRCHSVVDTFKDKLDVIYYYKENSGQGFSRNYGFERANGDYFVVFDSDCIIPKHYFETVTQALSQEKADCWGGPDRAHSSFSDVQKAINFSMTSLLTTGGIRGKKKRVGDFHPRSFNMGISRHVYEKTGGYKITRMGEDLEFSIRIINNGFRSILIEEAFVYHKRRTDLIQFFKQLHFFGRARVNIFRFHPNELKAVHFFPALFFVSLLLVIPLAAAGFLVFQFILLLYLAYACALFFAALSREKKVSVAIISVFAAFIQLTAYGVGFLSEYHRSIVRNP